MVNKNSKTAQISREESPVRSWRSMVWRQYRRHTVAMIATFVMLVLTAAVYLAPLIAPYEFDAIDLKHVKEPPSREHWMGTDDLGRDLFTRILYGGRISLSIGIFSALVATIFGSLMGAVSGYYGGSVDNLLMRFTDIIYSIPSLPLLIVLTSYTNAAVPAMVLIIGFLSWMATARVVRSSVLSLKAQDFVLAARMIGTRDHSVIFRHILPNSLAPIIVSATVGIGGTILNTADLGFLGLGAQPAEQGAQGRGLLEVLDEDRPPDAVHESGEVALPGDGEDRIDRAAFGEQSAAMVDGLFE